MGSLNKVMLIGNLGRDAELRYTGSGTAVATLNIATTETWNKGGQKQEKTEWHRVVLWGKSAESLKNYLTKGKQIYVEGSLETQKWTDKDGGERQTVQVKAFKVTLLSGASGGNQNRGNQNRGNQQRSNQNQQRGNQRQQNYSNNDETPWDDSEGAGDDGFLGGDEGEWQPPV